MRSPRLVICAALVACASRTPAPSASFNWPAPPASRVHKLELTPETVAWGWYDAAGTPVLTINSGDEIDVQTASTCSTAMLVRAGLDSTEVQPEVRHLYAIRSSM